MPKKLCSGFTRLSIIAATVSYPFRVVNIFDKYYNKWFMSKEKFKTWMKEAKPYKLEVRMLTKNPLH